MSRLIIIIITVTAVVELGMIRPGYCLNAGNSAASPFSIARTADGNNISMLSIDSIPAALCGDVSLTRFLSYMFYFLFSIGIVLSLFEGYRHEIIGKGFSYYGLFLRIALIAAGYLSWKQQGMSNFASVLLTLADRVQLFLIKQNINSLGGSVSQIVCSVSHSLKNVSIPTVSSNGTSSVETGWNLNPVSWFAGAAHALTGTVLVGIIWFLFNVFYGLIQLLTALVQLILIGLLFALCPIILGFESIPYTSGIFGKWLKMFIEVSAWGILAAFEQLVFFIILGKILSPDIPSLGTGIGNILGLLTFTEAVTVFSVMTIINLTVPFLIGKLFEGISSEAVSRIEGLKAIVVGAVSKL